MNLPFKYNYLNPPDWLKGAGKRFWNRWVPVLQANHIFNESNRDLIATCCNHFGVYREAVDTLNEQGRVVTTHTGATKPNPWVAIEKQSWEMFCRGFKELGISTQTIVPQRDELDVFLDATEVSDK